MSTKKIMQMYSNSSMHANDNQNLIKHVYTHKGHTKKVLNKKNPNS